MFDDEQLRQVIEDSVLGNVSVNSKNYGFSSIDDKELQKIIDETFLDALDDVGEVGFQETVEEWKNEMERYVKCQEMKYQKKSKKQSSNVGIDINPQIEMD